MASTVTTLYDFATELLAEAVAALATTAAGAPASQFVSYALPSLDCPEQLTVDVRAVGHDSNRPTAPGQARGHLTQYGHVTNLGTFVVTMTRCVPVVDGMNGQLPPPAEIQAAAGVILEDGWAFWNHMTSIIKAGTLWGGRCTTIYRDPGVPVQGQGGSAGWAFSMRPVIDGYRP